MVALGAAMLGAFLVSSVLWTRLWCDALNLGRSASGVGGLGRLRGGLSASGDVRDLPVFDVVVCGAGPSGLSLAAECSKRDLSARRGVARAFLGLRPREACPTFVRVA